MGGNAFKLLPLKRIKREDILPTLKYVADQLQIPNLTFEYLKNNLMGSAGKQADSGDLDIAVDKTIFDIRKINSKARQILGDQYVSSIGLKGGQINTAWPIKGDPENGFIQVDFIVGKPEWLKFSHHSPGERSKYKGVYISTLLGVLAKMLKDFESWPEGADITDLNQRNARVGYQFDLERGLVRQWKMQKAPGQKLSKVDPDYWETNLKLPDSKIPPRFARTGFIDDPDDVIDILLPGVKRHEIETFEDLWNVVENHPRWKDRLEEIKSRFLIAINKSSAIKNSRNGKTEEPDIFKN